MKNIETFEKTGYLVLAGRNGPIFTHTLLHNSKTGEGADKFINNAKFRVMVGQIKSQKKSLILSAEKMDSYNQDTISALQKILEGYNVTVVAFHREQTALIRSVWAQSNKKKRIPETFDSWADNFLPTALTKESGIVDLHGTLDRYAQVFGNRSIRLISFEGALRISSLFDVFVRSCVGLSPKLFRKRALETNESPPSVMIHLVSMLSQITSQKFCLILSVYSCIPLFTKNNFFHSSRFKLYPTHHPDKKRKGSEKFADNLHSTHRMANFAQKKRRDDVSEVRRTNLFARGFQLLVKNAVSVLFF